MAFHVGQLRKDINKIYMAPIDVIPSYVKTNNPFGGEVPFYDFALQRTPVEDQNGQNVSPVFEAGETYYLRFSIKKIPQYYYSADNSLGLYNPNYVEADRLNLSLLLQWDRDNSNNMMIEDSTDDKSETFGNIQRIGTCYIPTKEEDLGQTKIASDYSSFTFVFTPRSAKRYIVFRIQRTTYDVIEKNNRHEGWQGRTWLLDEYYKNPAKKDKGLIPDPTERQPKTIKVTEGGRTITFPLQNNRIVYNQSTVSDSGQLNGQCSILKDIIDFDEGTKPWTKIGYQCRPGSLIVVNNEPIRIGRSGIFEINNGIKINSFKIAAPGGTDAKKIDAFLLDYAYTKTQSQEEDNQ